jgi:hypothetical protein
VSPFGDAVQSNARPFVTQLFALGVFFVVFDLLPNAAIARWTPESHQELATSILVAAKNPAVIAFTMLWMIGVAHVMMRMQMHEMREHRASAQQLVGSGINSLPGRRLGGGGACAESPSDSLHRCTVERHTGAGLGIMVAKSHKGVSRN